MRIAYFAAAAALSLTAAAVPAAAGPSGLKASHVDAKPMTESVRCWWRRGLRFCGAPTVWIGPSVYTAPRVYVAPRVWVGPGVYVRTY
jgi:hypothetical protein